jgi:signal transduction histidine kinase
MSVADLRGVVSAPAPVLVTGARWVLPAAGLGLCLLAVSVATTDRIVITTYSATSAAAAVADVGTGLLLVGASALGLASPRTTGRGVALGLIALTWFAHDLVGWQDGSSVARSVGLVMVPFTLPLVAHVAQVARPVLAVAYSSAAVFSVGHALFRDPFRDVHCWSNCSANDFLVQPVPEVVRVLDALWTPVVVALALVVVGTCVLRLRGLSAVARRSGAPVLVPVAAAALSLGIGQLQLWWNPAEDPRSPWFVGAFLLQALGLAALASGVTLAMGRDLATRRAVTRLVELLGAGTDRGSLGSALAHSLGDPGLQVAYWLPGQDSYVDAEGRRVDPSPGPDQVETVIQRAGRRVAVVVHDRGVPLASDLQSEIGSAARLAVDNERLRAEVLAHLADLGAARTRIVDTADAIRRRIERDLHDGAQQGLLVVSYELRLAASTARDQHARDVLDMVSSGSTTVQKAFRDLRELSHGIFPTVLTVAGLQPALRALAVRASVPFDIDGQIDVRLPAATEAAVYFVVADALARAEQRGATFVEIRLVRTDRAIDVIVSDDGPPQSEDALVHVADRLGAMGGHLESVAPEVRVVIPCA